jgi:hypothetical protein
MKFVTADQELREAAVRHAMDIAHVNRELHTVTPDEIVESAQKIYDFLKGATDE